MFSIENFKIISNLGPLQRMSGMTKHLSKAGKVDLGDRVTVHVKFQEMFVTKTKTQLTGSLGPSPYNTFLLLLFFAIF